MPFGRNSETLTILLRGKDKFSKVFKKAKTEVGGLKSALGKIGIAAGAAGTAVAGMAAAIGVKAVKAAAHYNKQMANISTLVDTSKESMAKMKEEVMDLAEKSPVAVDDLTTSLYQVRSAGVDAEDAMSVLEHSMKLGVAGLGTTEEATNLLTSTFNNFAKQGLSTQEMADILFKTVRAGKTTISELSQSFGDVAPVAGQMGIRFEELQAATAALTTTGQNASEAQHGLRGMMTALIKPSKGMKELFEDLGMDSGKELVETSGGLIEAFKKLWDATGKNEEQLGKAVGRVEALNSTLSLVSKEGGAAQTFIEAEEDMVEGSNKLEGAYSKVKESAEEQWDILKNKLNVALWKLGDKILPHVVDVVKRSLIPALDDFLKWTDENEEGIELFFFTVAESINNVAEAFGWAVDKMEDFEAFLIRLTQPPVGGEEFPLTTPEVAPEVREQMKRQDYISPYLMGGAERPAITGGVYFNFQGAFIGNKEQFKDEVKNAINRDLEIKALAGE